VEYDDVIGILLDRRTTFEHMYTDLIEGIKGLTRVAYKDDMHLKIKGKLV
jgi:hypothetical protein